MSRSLGLPTANQGFVAKHLCYFGVGSQKNPYFWAFAYQSIIIHYSMKAIIPVAGAGTRLRPHTYTRPKPLIPVAGKPILAFIIDQLLQAGIREFVLVIGYLGGRIQQFVKKRYPDLDVHYVHQEQRLGLGHAVWEAREHFARGEEVFIVLGDTIFEAELQSLLAKPGSWLGIHKVDEPREFGVVERNDDGSIRRMVEKPRIPKSNWAIVGLYKICETQALTQALQYLLDKDLRTAGEIQLTDALMQMVQGGVRIGTVEINNWFDCGKKEILLETNAALLRRTGYATPDLSGHEGSILIPPVFIGRNCSIRHSIVGPHVTLGDETVITGAIVRNSIVGDNTCLENIILHDSVVGSDSDIKGFRQSLNLGDNTEIDFH